MTAEEFIFEYLKADQDTGAGSYEKMMSCITTLDWNLVNQYILKLRYFYFLRTSYWMIISNEVKRRAGWKCSCGCREGLQTHHTEEGNKYHGEEHVLLQSGRVGLECTCEKCHRILHGISVKETEKKQQRNQRKEILLAQLPQYPEKMSEENITGSSFTLTRKMLEELEHERKVVINRGLYGGWTVYRCT